MFRRRATRVAIDQIRDALRQIEAIFDGGIVSGLSDGELLERFVKQRDEVAEIAFAELIRRHGPMVLRVCKASIRNEHDAHDAFQATFLILVQKSGSLWARESLGPWLHAVASRIAAGIRSAEVRRKRHEQKLGEQSGRFAKSEIRGDDDGLVHDEVRPASGRHRAVLVLCDLEGLTHEEAAQRLGWPTGTVKSRQTRARARLRSTLIRRGLGPSGAALSLTLLSDAPSPPVPSGLAEVTLQTAVRIVRNKLVIATLAAAPVAALTQQGLRTMTLLKLKMIALTILAATLLTSSAAIVVHTMSEKEAMVALGRANRRQQDPKNKPSATKDTAAKPKGEEHQTPREAFQDLIQQYDLVIAERGIRALQLRDRRNAPRPAEQAQAEMAGERAFTQNNLANENRIRGEVLDLAERNPRTDTAEIALVFLTERRFPGSERVKELLARDHVQSDRLREVLGPLFVSPWYSEASERLLRGALGKSPYRDIRGNACYFLAEHLATQAASIRLLLLRTPEEPQGGPGQQTNRGGSHGATSSEESRSTGRRGYTAP